ncbi:MAG: thioredoxin, partial [Oscillospiraceae bacterium]
MALLHVSTPMFAKTINSSKVTMVDFWASWCGPCHMVAPTIEKLATQYDGRVLVGKVDVDAEPALAAQFQIMSIPTVIFFKDGKEVSRRVGVQPASAFTAAL